MTKENSTWIQIIDPRVPRFAVFIGNRDEVWTKEPALLALRADGQVEPAVHAKEFGILEPAVESAGYLGLVSAETDEEITALLPVWERIGEENRQRAEQRAEQRRQPAYAADIPGFSLNGN